MSEESSTSNNVTYDDKEYKRLLSAAKRWLKSEKGEEELTEWILQKLLIHLQLEAEESKESRMSRKQFKENSEMIMNILQARGKNVNTKTSS